MWRVGNRSGITWSHDTTAAAATCALSGTIAPDAVTCTVGSAAFASAAVGTAKTVTASGLTLGGAAASNYTLSNTSATTTASITAAPVTAIVNVAGKVYDGSTSASVTSCTVNGAVAGDVVGCTVGAASFDTATVGAGKTVTATGITLTGPAAGDYTVASDTVTTTAAITARVVSAAVTVANKPYDGTNSATVAGCSVNGVLAGDTVTCSASAAAFATASAGANQVVTVSGLTLGGPAAASYTLAQTTVTAFATITGTVVTATVTAADKSYDVTTAAILTSCTVLGAINGDDVGCTGTASFDTADVGSGKTVTVPDLILTGASVANYTLASTTATTTASITAVQLTASVTVLDKPYDRTTTAALTNCALSGGLIIVETIGCTASATFDSPTVGTGKTVTVTGITLSGSSAGKSPRTVRSAPKT